MQLDDNTIIDDSLMEKACRLAIRQYIFFDSLQPIEIPKYTNRFRSKLKTIKTAQKPLNNIGKRIAVIALICVIGFSSVIAVNAEMRRKVFDWIVETFPQFSIFSTQNADEKDSVEELKTYTITYIPIGFKLSNTLVGKSMIVYEYINDNGTTISATFKLPDSISYMDTENTEINQFIYKDNIAYWWKTDGFTYLVWQQDRYQCNITAELCFDEVLKIANSVKK